MTFASSQVRRGLNAACLSVAGRRSHNEDAVIVDDALMLFAVADGVGGYTGGEVASQLALDEVSSYLRALRADKDLAWPFPGDPELSPEANALEMAIRLADRAVCDARTSETANMGSTIAALRVVGKSVVIGHVGDSRVYRWRGGELEALTRDHSMIEELRTAHAVDESALPKHLSHVITRALGVSGWDRVTMWQDKWRRGDRYLLCTDGLHGWLSPSEIALGLGRGTVHAVVEGLVHEATAAGSTDNVSAVVVDIG